MNTINATKDYSYITGSNAYSKGKKVNSTNMKLLRSFATPSELIRRHIAIKNAEAASGSILDIQQFIDNKYVKKVEYLKKNESKLLNRVMKSLKIRI